MVQEYNIVPDSLGLGTGNVFNRFIGITTTSCASQMHKPVSFFWNNAKESLKCIIGEVKVLSQYRAGIGIFKCDHGAVM